MSFLKNRFHESYDRKQKFSVGSDKKFGFTFAAIFLFCAIFFKISFLIKTLFALLALIFAAISILKPSRLHKINVIWGRFGLLINKIVSPVVLAILFYFVFMPVGLFLKITGKDILNKKINKKIATYWVDSSRTLNTSMRDQF